MVELTEAAFFARLRLAGQAHVLGSAPMARQAGANPISTQSCQIQANPSIENCASGTSLLSQLPPVQHRPVGKFCRVGPCRIAPIKADQGESN